jgi:hypothetical protein
VRSDQEEGLGDWGIGVEEFFNREWTRIRLRQGFHLRLKLRWTRRRTSGRDDLG